jgi:hypothetical protein
VLKLKVLSNVQAKAVQRLTVLSMLKKALQPAINVKF